MILKEAFRMQNHLNDMSNQAVMFLADTSNVTRTKEEHLRSKSNPKAENETVEIKRQTDMVADKVIELYLDVLEERNKLSKAIGKAKTLADIDIDAAIASNKAKQEAVSRFENLSRLKSSETSTNGKDFLINAEGNQTPYIYTVRSVTTIDFDREAVKGIIRRLQRETDDVSSKIDLLNVTLEVAYTPKYDIGDTFEDAYDKYYR